MDVSAAYGLLVTTPGFADDQRLHAWSFSFDGHVFYVLSLGFGVTLVYDLATGRWAQWRTEGFEYWNMAYGTMWRDIPVGGAPNGTELWYIALRNEGAADEEGSEDEKPVMCEVTGMFAVRPRDYVDCGSVYVIASVGEELAEPRITLDVSDDGGRNYVEMWPVELEALASYQEAGWVSLGQMEAPGRVFRIRDNGFRRIDGATVDDGSE